MLFSCNADTTLHKEGFRPAGNENRPSPARPDGICSLSAARLCWPWPQANYITQQASRPPCSLGEAGQPVGAGHSGTCRQARGKLLALRAGRRRGEDYISRQAARAGRRRGEKPVAPRWRSIRTCCSWTSTGCWGSARRRRRRRSAP